MPQSPLGQLVTFAIETDDDQRFEAYIWIAVRKGDTVQKIATRRGHPERARAIADMNGIRSVRSVLSRKRIRVPGQLRAAGIFHVLAGDSAPQIVDGYANYETVDRPGRVGLTVFSGYNPITMEVPIVFEGVRDGRGVDIERDIRLLERMAGRGNFPGTAVGPPPVVRVSTTNGQGQVVPLIASNYQWSLQNPSAPLWRVAAIDWDPDPLRNRAGNRIRQRASVTLQQHVRVSVASRSVAARSRSKPARRKRRR